LNDGRIQNPSKPFGIVPLSNFVQKGFGFVHHSIALLYHEVPNPSLTIRKFFIAVRRGSRAPRLPCTALVCPHKPFSLKTPWPPQGRTPLHLAAKTSETL
jgi:hypothetical protein